VINLGAEPEPAYYFYARRSLKRFVFFKLNFAFFFSLAARNFTGGKTR
jgi:hypothetical protein